MSHNFSLNTIIANRERQFVAPPFCHREERDSLRRKIKAKEIEKTKPNSAGEIRPSDVAISLLNLWQILKSDLDRVKSSGLPRKRNHELAMTPCPVTPEWFYQGSTVFKAFGFPPCRHPGNL